MLFESCAAQTFYQEPAPQSWYVFRNVSYCAKHRSACPSVRVHELTFTIDVPARTDCPRFWRPSETHIVKPDLYEGGYCKKRTRGG